MLYYIIKKILVNSDSRNIGVGKSISIQMLNVLRNLAFTAGEVHAVCGCFMLASGNISASWKARDR